MVTALIFAGGTGVRMNSRSKPKQFLELHGKPIIIYTMLIAFMAPWCDYVMASYVAFGLDDAYNVAGWSPELDLDQ